MNTIAECYIRVKLGLDKSDLKSMTKEQLGEVSKAMDTNISRLRQQARNYKIIGFELGKISKALFKYMVAPGVALGTLGVMKYMQTTSKGANLLRYSMAELRWSFDQFLARVGKTIYDSGILTKVIDKLKNILDNLDAEKIKQIFTVVKWAAIFYALSKILSTLALMEGAIKRVGAAILWLSKLGIAGEVGTGVAATGTVVAKKGARKLAGDVGTGAAIGAGGGGGILGSIYAGIKAIRTSSQVANRAKALTIAAKLGRERIKKYPNITGRSSAKSAVASIEETQRTIGAISPHIFAGMEKQIVPLARMLSVLGKIGKVLVRFATGLFIFDAIISVLSGIFGKREALESGWSALTAIFGKLWWVLKGIAGIFTIAFDAINTGFQSIGVILKGIFSLNFQRMADELSKLWDAMIERIGIGIGAWWTPLEKMDAANREGEKRKKEADPFRFLPANVYTTSFSGLQQAAQDMITKENQINAVNKNTAAVDNAAVEISALSKTIMDYNKSLGENKKEYVNPSNIGGNYIPFAKGWSLNVM